MFGRPNLALIIMLAHYLSSLSVGFLMRFHAPGAPSSQAVKNSGGNLLGRGLQSLLEAREKDARPLGRLMGDAVRTSVNTLLLIGGFIIMFSVMIRMLQDIGALHAMVQIFSTLLAPLKLCNTALTALITGLFEVTLGTQMASQVTGTLLQGVMAASAIIAWSGLSVHAQVAAIIHDTDINMLPFILARVAHAFLAGLYTLLLWQSEYIATITGQLLVSEMASPLAIAWGSTKTLVLIAVVLTLGPILWILPRQCLASIQRQRLW